MCLHFKISLYFVIETTFKKNPMYSYLFRRKHFIFYHKIYYLLHATIPKFVYADGRQNGFSYNLTLTDSFCHTLKTFVMCCLCLASYYDTPLCLSKYKNTTSPIKGHNTSLSMAWKQQGHYGITSNQHKPCLASLSSMHAPLFISDWQWQFNITWLSWFIYNFFQRVHFPAMLAIF